MGLLADWMIVSRQKQRRDTGCKQASKEREQPSIRLRGSITGSRLLHLSMRLEISGVRSLSRFGGYTKRGRGGNRTCRGYPPQAEADSQIDT